MPLYEYVCDECGYHFDMLRPMSDADKPVACQKCNSALTHRVVSLFFAQGDGHSLVKNNGCSGCHSSSCASCRS